MDALGLIAPLVLADLFIATWTAWLADRRGRQFWVYFTVCLLLPGVALVVVPYLLVFVRPATGGLRSWWRGDDLRNSP